MNCFRSKNVFWRTILALVFGLILVKPCYCQKTVRLIIPQFEKGSFVSAGQYLLNRLMETLVEEGKIDVIGPELIEYYLERKGRSPSEAYSLENIVKIGRELEGDLVLWGRINKREINSKAGFSIPYILTKYRHQAQLSVTLKLFDLGKGEMVLARNLDVFALGEGGTAWFVHPGEKLYGELSALEEEKLLREAEEKAAYDMAKVVFKVLKKRG